MSRWDEAFENHEIHDSIEAFKNTVESAKPLSVLKEQDRFEDIARFEQIIHFVENKLRLIDPNLINSSLLNQISQEFKNADSQLSQFISTENIGNLNNANSQIDNLLNRVSNLNILITEDDVENLNESIVSFRRSLGQHLRHLRDEIENLEEKTPSLNEDLNELKSEIQQQKNRVDQVITEFQKQFSETEEKRREEFANSKSKRKEEHDAIIQNTESKFNELFDAQKEKSEAILEEIRNKKEKASEIVQIISNSGMAGGFAELAKKERTSRNIFRIFAVLAFLGLIGFGFYVFVTFPDDGMEISAISIRIFVGITIGILIAYLAKQAEKHERHFRRNKMTALQMAALDPYISELDEAEQKEIKKELTSNFFHRDLSGDKTDLKTGEFETKANLQDIFQFIKSLKS